MTALAISPPKLWVPRFEPWRLLRPVQMAMQDLSSGFIGAPGGHGLQSSHFSGGEVAALPDIEFTDHGDDSDGSNTSVYDFGPFSTTREKVLVCVGAWDFGPTLNISSMVADPSGSADAFTHIASSGQLGSSSILNRVEIWGLDGTLSSDTIRVTWSESIYGSAITVISVDNLQSFTEEDSQNSDTPGDTSLDFDTLSAVSAGGVALFCAATQANNANSWSGFSGTELSDFDLEGNHFSAWISDPDYDGSTITVSASGSLQIGTGVTLR